MFRRGAKKGAQCTQIGLTKVNQMISCSGMEFLGRGGGVKSRENPGIAKIGLTPPGPRICGGMEAAPPGSEQLRRLRDSETYIFGKHWVHGC